MSPTKLQVVGGIAAVLGCVWLRGARPAGGAAWRASRAAAADTAAVWAWYREQMYGTGGAEPPEWLARLQVGRLVAAARAQAAAEPDAPAPVDPEVLRRTIDAAPTPHYLAAMLDDDGAGLRRWRGRAAPLGVWVQRPPAEIDSLAGMDAQVAELFTIWNGLGLGVAFAPEADSTRADVHVTWARALGGAPRYAGAVQTGNTQLVTDARGWAVAAHVVLGARFDRATVQDAALHEAGHVLGLGHSPNADDVMTPVTAGRHFAMTDADVNTARLLYALRPGPAAAASGAR